MATLEAAPTKLPPSSAEPRRVLQLLRSNSVGDLPFGSSVLGLTPGVIDILNEKGELVARIERLWTKTDEAFQQQIEELIAPDLEELQRRMRDPGPLVSFAEVKRKLNME